MKAIFIYLAMCAAPALFAVSTPVAPAAVVIRPDGSVAKVLTVARDVTQERTVDDLVVVVGPVNAPQKDDIRAAAAAVAADRPSASGSAQVHAPEPGPEANVATSAAPTPTKAPKAPPAAPVVNLDLQSGGKVAIAGDPPLDTRSVNVPVGSSITVAPKSSADSSAANVPNPFDVRFIPSAVLDEYAFRVTATMWGKQPVVFINNRPLSAGEQVQGFTIYRIRTDGCILERGGLYFFLPRGAPITIRLPKS